MLQQQDKFWRIMAVLAVLSIFYAGYGLHRAASNPHFGSNETDIFLDGAVIRTANAGEVTKYSADLLVTVSEQGNEIYFWDLGGRTDGIPKLVNSRKYRQER